MRLWKFFTQRTILLGLGPLAKSVLFYYGCFQVSVIKLCVQVAFHLYERRIFKVSIVTFY